MSGWIGTGSAIGTLHPNRGVNGKRALNMFSLFNIPNALTVMRIIMVPAIVIFLIENDFFAALILFTLSAISDSLDGFLARVLHQQTTFGAYLDPIADKALIMSSFVILSVKDVIPGWLTVLVISRDCIIIFGIGILVLMSALPEIRPSIVSKITTALQLFTVFVVLTSHSFHLPIDLAFSINVLYFLTAVFTAISGLHYLIMGISLMNKRGTKHILP